MAYNAAFINRLAQFGTVTYDLVLTDDAGIMPEVRSIVSVNEGDESRLPSIAQSNIDAATESYNQPVQ